LRPSGRAVRFSCGLVTAAFEEVAYELMTTRSQN
jgi:hypothetical protein